MAAYDYNNTDWAAIKRLSQWYSGDIHDVLDGRGPYGYLKGISQFGVLAPGQVVCGPVSTVLYEKSSRVGQPQDVYHGAIDAVVKGGILMVDSSCAEGSGTGELMSSGAKTKGAAATVVNGTVRDLADLPNSGHRAWHRRIAAYRREQNCPRTRPWGRSGRNICPSFP